MKTSIQVLILLAVILTGVAATSSVFLAGSVKVQVVDSKGRPVGGEPVHIFKKGDVKCKCLLGVCVPNSVANGVTKKKEERGTSGQVEFTTLAPGTDYTACIGVKCNSANNNQCNGDQQCGVKTENCVNFTTDRKGNAPVVKIIKP